MNDLVSKIRTLEAEIARNAPTKKVLAVTTSLAMAQLAAFFVLIGPYAVIFWFWGVTGEVGIICLRFLFTALYVMITGRIFVDSWDWDGSGTEKTAELRKQLEEARRILCWKIEAHTK